MSNKYFKYKFKNNITHGGCKFKILLEKYFDANNIIITDIEKDGQYHVEILCNESEINNIIFYINKIDKNIFISNFAKCGNSTGSEIITKIISFAKDLQSNKIFLIDASQIFFGEDCEMDMARYMILLHGQSWYNRFGFYNIAHERQKVFNEAICKKSLVEFIDCGVRKMKIKKKEKFDGSTYNKDIIISHLLQIDDKINVNMTIRNVMIILSDKLKKNNYVCDNIASIIKIIVDFANLILVYNPKLELNLSN